MDPGAYDQSVGTGKAYQMSLMLANQAGIENIGVGILLTNFGQLYIANERYVLKGTELLNKPLRCKMNL